MSEVNDYRSILGTGPPVFKSPAFGGQLTHRVAGEYVKINLSFKPCYRTGKMVISGPDYGLIPRTLLGHRMYCHLYYPNVTHDEEKLIVRIYNVLASDQELWFSPAENSDTYKAKMRWQSGKEFKIEHIEDLRFAGHEANLYMESVGLLANVKLPPSLDLYVVDDVVYLEPSA